MSEPTSVNRDDRAPAAALTDEDSFVWWEVRHRIVNKWGGSGGAYLGSRQDCRDADLMLQAQGMRAMYFKFNPLVAAFEDTDKIPCGGSLRDLWADYPELAPQS